MAQLRKPFSKDCAIPTHRSSALSRLGIWFVLSTSAILLPSCMTTNSEEKVTDLVDATRVACLVFKPFYWHANDTPGSVKQAKEHNAAGKALCGWGAP